MTTTRRPSWAMPLATALAVLVLLAILYPGPLLRGDVFLSADAQNSDALRQVGDAGRREGSYPLWNPYLFIGMPTFGSLAYTPGLYPPPLVLEFLHDTLGMPPLTWMLAHLLFGGLGMVWLLGRWPLPPAARLLGAVGWLFFAGTVAWGVHGHGTKLGAAMYLPWLAGLAWEVLTRGSLRAVALAGLLLGLQVLRGHVQITYYTLLLLGWLAAWNLAWPLDSLGMRGAEPKPPLALRARRAGLLAGAIVLGLLVGAVMLLPVREYAAMSTRGQGDAGGGAGFQYATAWSLGAREVVTLVQPGAVGFGKATYLGPMPFNDYPNYFGWLWLLLAAAAWWSGRRSLVAGARRGRGPHAPARARQPEPGAVPALLCRDAVLRQVPRAVDDPGAARAGGRGPRGARRRGPGRRGAGPRPGPTLVRVRARRHRRADLPHRGGRGGRGCLPGEPGRPGSRLGQASGAGAAPGSVGFAPRVPGPRGSGAPGRGRRGIHGRAAGRRSAAAGWSGRSWCCSRSTCSRWRS